MKMKRLSISFLLLSVAVALSAMPAKRGLWTTLKLTDGKEVRAQLCGDEHMRYMQAEDGTRYTLNGEILTSDRMQKMVQRAQQRRSILGKSHAAKREKMRRAIGSPTAYKGEKRALVIMAEFTDKKFAAGHGQEKFHDILNKKGYSTSEGFRGSAHDYFWDQSGHQFSLWFDVVGPYKLSQKYSFYGANDSNGEEMDSRLTAFVRESVEAASAAVPDGSVYDWDGDGVADLVFIVYAYKGEADSHIQNTIWPHMYNYKLMTDEPLYLNGVEIDTYACSNEIQGDGGICGIGTFCHEFSHCLGFPDFYDVNYGSIVGTDEYDLMCSGGYNGNGFCPPAYTSYERWTAGWQEPIELDADRSVEEIQPFSEWGNSYIIYNKAHPDEYYIMENRQKKGWDEEIPGKGLLVYHVDYDKDIWDFNVPNSKGDFRKYDGPVNDHERMAIVKANNRNSGYNRSGFPYPYGTNNELTKESTPAAKLYNANVDGTKYLDGELTGIKQNSNGTISFVFRNGVEPEETIEPVDAAPVFEVVEEGEPGPMLDSNPIVTDGYFEKVASVDEIVTEKEYILVNEEKQMAIGKFSTGFFVAVPARFEEDALTVSGTTALKLESNEGGNYTLQLPSGKYLTTEKAKLLYTAKEASAVWTVEQTEKGLVVSASPLGTILFCSNAESAPYFVNDVEAQESAVLYVKVEKEEPTPPGSDDPETAIRELQSVQASPYRIYTLDGRYVGTDLRTLRQGVYVVNGRKVVK